MLLLTPAVGATRFAVLGDYGAATVAEGQVADLIKSWDPDFIITTGDNSYGPNGIDFNIGQYYADFIGSYFGFYGPGSRLNRFFPSAGNHDYSDGGGFAAYLSYFTLPGTQIASTASSGNPRYYDFVRGPIHFFALNSNFQETDGTTPNSVQGLWLQAQLASSPLPWKIVFMHHPPYSSSQHGSSPFMQWPFEDWGVSLVMAGHDHTYERILRDNNNDGDSLTYIVTGLGGRSIYSFPPLNLVTGSQVRFNATYGANLIEATDSTLEIKFIAINGVTIDSLRLTRSPDCCLGSTGNVNGIGDVDLLDLSAMVELFIGEGYQFACTGEANIDRAGKIDLRDLSFIIAYLQGVIDSLPMCP
ncbi:MAG: metallophosphoesterase [bacterium]|nr:metallophosphoesterase [bacterium]